jgi:hypothetical protein
MPTLVLAHASIEPDEADLFLLLFDLFGNGRLQQTTETDCPAQCAQHLSACEAVLGTAASI